MNPCDFDGVRRYRDVGVDQVIFLVFAPTPDRLRASLEELASTMVEPAKAL